MKSFKDIANESLEEVKQRKGEDNNKLLEQLKSINHQIANYPTPIAGCDAQFNFLLEEKERISKIITFNKEHKTNSKEIGPLATPDLIHFTPGLPKTRSGKIMRRILRKVAENDYSNLGDTSTLADPSVVQSLIDNRLNK